MELESFFPYRLALLADAVSRSMAQVYAERFDLTREEGMCLGGSSGINIAGAMAMAKKLGPGSTVVTILCDYGNRYLSKLYNGAFLKEKGLPVPDWFEG